MDKRTELKARMLAHYGMEEHAAWVCETARILSHIEVEQELEFFRALQGA